MEDYDRARLATGVNTIRRMRMERLITTATDTFRICNTNCFSTAKMVTEPRLSGMLYVHCVSCEGLVSIVRVR